ncbi:hypothetical protein FRB95_006688 [Tulasnella sp. JGI-2019a]|nr:hypothetical protein FRB95_006688 [Tulasnella sp. JGI-2019a]
MAARLCQPSSYVITGIGSRSRTSFLTATTPRYRYYSTPVIPPQTASSSKSHIAGSHSQLRHAHAAAQPIVSEPFIPFRPTGSSRDQPLGFPVPSRDDRELEEMESAFASSKMDAARSSSSSMRNAPAWMKKRMSRYRGRDPVAFSMRNVAEEPWLEQDDDPSIESEEFQDKKSRRYDWRKRAISRLPKSALPKRLKRVKPTITPALPWEDDYDAVRAYRAKFRPLIRLEQLAADAVLEERLNEWPVERLQEEGYAILKLKAFWSQHKHFGRPVAVFTMGPGVILPMHNFEPGNQVRMTGDLKPPSPDAAPSEPTDISHDHRPLTDRLKNLLDTDDDENGPPTGSILNVSLSQIKVSFDKQFPLEGSWRMDLWSSDIALQRMIAAVDSMSSDLDDQEAHPRRGHEWIFQGTRLRHELLSSFHPGAVESLDSGRQVPNKDQNLSEGDGKRQPPIHRTQAGAFADNQMIQSWAARYMQSNPLVMEGDPVINLNESQIKAMAMMIGNGLSLVQGPPGTGKTKIIIEAVRLLKVHFQVPQPILVCTYTNVAVDNLLEAFAASGVKSLRVGAPGRVKESLAMHSLEAKIDGHPQKPRLNKLENEISALQAKIKKSVMGREKMKDAKTKEKETIKIEKLRASLSPIKNAFYELRMDVLHEIVWSADVICTTCLTAASYALNVVDFSVVFLDEASMCTEPASLVPIMKGSEHVALIGDHKQLPPIITSPEALEGGLGVSLFERLITEDKVPTVMLDRQYRMHPSISAFPNKEFYGGAIQDGTINQETGLALTKLDPPKSRYLPVLSTSSSEIMEPSVMFLDHSCVESKKDKSRVNHGEAQIVCNIVEDLLAQNPDLHCESIGVIAPYAAQMTLLRRLFRDDPYQHGRFKQALGAARALSTANIEVKTVDGFEGREKDVIIFSTVRNNTSGYIGFLADRRRLNVGLTRAKRALFVVGNERTLRLGKVGYVEGGGLSVVGGGAGARNVKVDLGVDVAGKAAVVTTGMVGESTTTPSHSESSLASTADPVTPKPKKVVIKTKDAEGGVWRRYLDWLKEWDLISRVQS